MGKGLRNIFKKKNEVDKLAISIQESSKLTRLEKISIAFTIISGIVTLFLSIEGIILTRKYGESKEQIDRLSIISENQKFEVGKLIEMVKELKAQNSLTQEQNLELKKQGHAITGQTLDLSKQLELSQEERQNALRQSKIDTKLRIKEIDELGIRLSDILFKNGPNHIKDYSTLQQKDVYNRVKGIFLKLSSNYLILRNDSLLTKLEMIDRLLYFGNLNIEMDNARVVMVNGHLRTTEDSIKLEEDKIVWFRKFIEDCFRFMSDLFSYINALKKEYNLL